jgi:hypothetical protein
LRANFRHAPYGGAKVSEKRRLLILDSRRFFAPSPAQLVVVIVVVVVAAAVAVANQRVCIVNVRLSQPAGAGQQLISTVD